MNDTFEFFEKVFDDNLTKDSISVLYIGDWNITLNQLLDTSEYLHENNDKNITIASNSMSSKSGFCSLTPILF